MCVLSDFLCDRTQQVVLPNGTSTLRSVISGVPQGSVLGSILFLMYINDIVDLFSNSNVSTKLFANDINYLELTSEADYSTLQKSINKNFG